MEVEEIARVCHEANKGLCEANGDFSQRTWDEAEEWQRESAISGVKFLQVNPYAPDSVLHEQWRADKVADGWVYGPEKDPEAKTHPCLVDFDQLPRFQQDKDVLFKAVVASLT